MIDSLLEEFTDRLQRSKEPLINKSHQYSAQKIKHAPGEKIVAVLGAAHVPGIKKEINQEHDLKRLSERPPKSNIPKYIGWAIPILILSIIAYTFFANFDAGVQQSISWILWNGSFSALGAAIAFGHPLTIISAFIAAPLTSLNPLIAAGIVAGIVQAFIRKPNVRDF